MPFFVASSAWASTMIAMNGFWVYAATVSSKLIGAPFHDVNHAPYATSVPIRGRVKGYNHIKPIDQGYIKAFFRKTLFVMVVIETIKVRKNGLDEYGGCEMVTVSIQDKRKWVWLFNLVGVEDIDR